MAQGLSALAAGTRTGNLGSPPRRTETREEKMIVCQWHLEVPFGKQGEALKILGEWGRGKLGASGFARATGPRVMGGTVVKYFHCTIDDRRKPDGSKWVCSPPIRTKADNAALWTAVRNNSLQAVSTDHCPFLYDGTKPMMYEGKPFQIAGKELGIGDFSKIPNGLPCIEDRMPILWTYGVGAGQLTLNRLVELCCTNPAKMFGIYPHKGTLMVGADADVVIWDPTKKKTMSASNSHQRTDYSLYEGWEVTGLPEKVYRRGELLVDGDAWHGKAGSGRWTARATNAPVL